MIRLLTIDELVKQLAEQCKAEKVSLLVLTERQGETEDDSRWEMWQNLRQDVDGRFLDLALLAARGCLWRRHCGNGGAIDG